MSQNTRLVELRQLTSADVLTREEIRYLKVRLSDVHTDLIGELPVELVTLIAVQLDRGDLARCLRVSKIWRQTFLSDSVMTAFAKRHWPAMVNGVVAQDGFLNSLSRLGRASYNFDLRHFDHTHPDFEFVRWDSKAHFKLDPEFHSRTDSIPDAYTRFNIDPDIDPSAFPPFTLYSHGKVARHLFDCIVVIDNLRLKTRKIFTPPSGIMHGLKLRLEALGSRLVVGTIDRMLYVRPILLSKSID
jgi:hypothetical protein